MWVLPVLSGCRLRMLLNLWWGTDSPRKEVPGAKCNSADKPWSASEGNSNLWELPELLCPATGLASVLRLP